MIGKKIVFFDDFLLNILSAAMFIQEFIFGTTFISRAVNALRFVILILSVILVLTSAHFGLQLIPMIVVGLLPNAYVFLFYQRNTPKTIEFAFQNFKNTRVIIKSLYLTLVILLTIVLPLVILVALLTNRH
jgi:hypothetical protein